jgi:thioredoxin 1
MSTVDLTADTFATTVKSNDVVFVDFWAAWCGPCKRFAPIYQDVSEENPEVVFAKVDTEAEPGLAQAFNITAIPTLVAIRNGVVLHSQPGALPRPALEKLVTAVKAVDMASVTSAQSQTEIE